MKKIRLFSFLSLTLLLFSCNNDKQFLLQTLDLATNLNLTLTTNQKVKICTSGPSTSCDSKDIVYINNLILTNYLTSGGPGRFVLQIASGNHAGEYIGIEESAWKTFYDATNGLANDFDKAQALRNFFQADFDTFGFLTPDATRPNYFLDKNLNQFSESADSIKDVEAYAANIEDTRVQRLEEVLNINYGLSADRAQSVARNISAYQRLSSKRSLTEKERNFFSNELLGVSYKEAHKALTSGDSDNLDDLLEKAASKNGTSPEQISSILSGIFL